MEIRTKVIALRTDLGLSREEFADKIGYHNSNLRDLEMGKTKAVSFDFISGVCSKFKLSIRYFQQDALTLKSARKVVELEKILVLLASLPEEEINVIKNILTSHFLQLKSKDAQKFLVENENTY